MRTRACPAAAAGALAAAGAHALDAAGQLPFVHEEAGVRLAMGPGLTVAWLLLAAGLAALAASTRVVVVGVPSAVIVSGFPELWGRHDLGAVVEPGALLGALLQVLLLLAVVSAALIVRDRITVLPAVDVAVLPRRRVPMRPRHITGRVVVLVERVRGPPAHALCCGQS